MSVPTLSKEELETPRTQEELCRWVTNKLLAFASSPEGKSIFRLNKRNPIKRFLEEMLPLMLFADAFYAHDSNVLFRLVTGSQSYDALVLDLSGGILLHIQITQAFDGARTHDRKVQLTQNRNVMTAVSIDEVFEHIQRAARRKSTMRYEKDTCLIVNVESFHFFDEYDLQALHEFMHREVLPYARNFKSLYLVADQPGFAYKYDIPANSVPPLPANV